MNSTLAASLPAEKPLLSEEVETRPENPVLILGLGNDILCDDGVGLHIIRLICQQLEPGDRVDVMESCEMGLSLLDLLVGYREVIVVDSIQTGQAPPGTVHELEAGELRIIPTFSPHFFGIPEILKLGRQLGLSMPEHVWIHAIEVADPFTVTTAMTPALQSVVPKVASTVLTLAREILRKAKLQDED